MAEAVARVGRVATRVAGVAWGAFGRMGWAAERGPRPTPPPAQAHILDRLAWSEMFESFLAAKYSAAKRFGLEGAETLIPGMKAMIDRAAELGVDAIVLGMPHRGRLSVLANVVRKPMAQIFSEFTGVRPGEGPEYSGTGDVKYHLGTSYDRPTVCGRRVHMSLLANPSHLEAVDPVLLGKARVGCRGWGGVGGGGAGWACLQRGGTPGRTPGCGRPARQPRPSPRPSPRPLSLDSHNRQQPGRLHDRPQKEPVVALLHRRRQGPRCWRRRGWGHGVQGAGLMLTFALGCEALPGLGPRALVGVSGVRRRGTGQAGRLTARLAPP